MLSISEAISDFSYKLNDCMTNKPTNKCIIHAELSNRKACTVTLYKHQSLAHLHHILTEAFNPTIPNVSKNVNIELTPISKKNLDNNSVFQKSDYIPPATPVEIYDVFVYNNQEMTQIVSIPYDSNTTLLEFMLENPSHTKKVFSVTAMANAYKIYIIDKAYLQQAKTLLKKV